MPITTMFGPSDAICAARLMSSTKPLLVLDDVVGRKHPDHRHRVAARQKKCRQSDRRRSIPSHWLGEDLFLLQTLKLAHNRVAKVAIGDDPEVLRLRQRQKALHRFLDHALLAIERQQLLGHALAA